MKFSGALLVTCLLVASNAYAGTKYPMPLIWDYNPTQQIRTTLWEKPTIKNDLTEVYNDWVKRNCYGIDDIAACVAGNPGYSQNGLFDDIAIATPDLNNDGKRDLILYMGSNTGLMGSGSCAMTDVWFYENTGTDYRNIGKGGFVVRADIALGAPKAKGKFRDIVTNINDDGCNNGKKIPPQIDKYNYKTNSYYDVKG